MKNKMKKRITGTGGLSRKIFTILILAAMPGLGFAVDNSIYIDQTGDNATITMTQDGANNQIKGVGTANYDATTKSIQGTNGLKTDSATIYGDNNNVTVSQIGAGNTLSLGIDSTVVSGVGVNLTYYTSGASNTGFININANGQGVAANTVANISQTGGGNSAMINLTGTGNTLNATQTGGSGILGIRANADSTTQTIATSGGTNNRVYTDLTGDKGTVNILAIGASNTITATQSGGGVNGHNVGIDLSGSSNTVTTSQSGTIDTTIGLKSVGSGNTFSITTRN
jgi:major curlin subunit